MPAVSLESSHISQEQQEDVINKKESKSKLLTVLKTKSIVYGLVLLIFLIVIAIAFLPKETTFIEKGEIEFIEKED